LAAFAGVPSSVGKIRSPSPLGQASFHFFISWVNSAARSIFLLEALLHEFALIESLPDMQLGVQQINIPSL
jgi:hypothetical protein